MFLSHPNASNYGILIVFLVAIVVQALYVTELVRKVETAIVQIQVPKAQAQQPSQTQPHPPQPQFRPQAPSTPATDTLPGVFVYRRTKKTGSSSMLEALLKVTKKYDYTTLYLIPDKMPHVVRAECLKANPRRLFVAQHNRVTRYYTPGRRTVIADTVYDGYRQITSYCRFVKNTKDCGDKMVECMESEEVLAQNYYRWAGNKQEDSSTYIDLPLSSAHPALSSTVLRHVFENVTLDVQRRNVASSACEEDERLREVYNRNYQELEAQVQTLRMRLLSMTGYPLRESGQKREYGTLSDILDAAEKIESRKYQFGPPAVQTDRVAKEHRLLMNNTRWKRSDSGVLSFVSNGKKYSAQVGG